MCVVVVVCFVFNNLIQYRPNYKIWLIKKKKLLKNTSMVSAINKTNYGECSITSGSEDVVVLVNTDGSG